MAAFILCLASANLISQEKNCKKGAIISISSSYVKRNFALLAELIVIQIQFSEI